MRVETLWGGTHHGKKIVHYHLPGLFEFYELYARFLPLTRAHPEYFYDWCDIASIYGAPANCLWGGGRVGVGDVPPAACWPYCGRTVFRPG